METKASFLSPNEERTQRGLADFPAKRTCQFSPKRESRGTREQGGRRLGGGLGPFSPTHWWGGRGEWGSQMALPPAAKKGAMLSQGSEEGCFAGTAGRGTRGDQRLQRRLGVRPEG